MRFFQTFTIRPGRTAFRVSMALIAQLAAPLAGIQFIQPVEAQTTTFYFSPDSGGENDIDPSSLNNQSDLSAYGVKGTGAANTTTQYGWKWDNPYLAGNNSQDVCVYLSSTTSGQSDPNAAEYAVCYSVITDAAGNITSQYAQSWYCPTYNTADASKGGQKCFGSSTTTLPPGVDIPIPNYELTFDVVQQFLTDPDKDSHVILDVYPNLDLDLVNICSKKSASPSSDSSDCALERAPAFLKLVKVVQDGTAAPSDWTLYWDGTDPNDGSVPGDNTQFYPVPDGTYTLSESSVANYEQVSLVCSPTANVDNTVTLDSGVEETCTFTNKMSVVAPAPRVIKGNTEGNDNVATLDEPGGSVTINVVVYNDAVAGIGDATLTSLTDDIYGDITSVHDNITDTTCVTGGVIASGSSYSCSFTVSITSEPATIHDTVTAILQNAHSSVSDSDDANITITPIAPTITVDKSANPTSLPEPGGNVEFTVVVTNNSFEPVTLTSLNDNVYGDLNGQGTCVTGGTIAAGGSYTCSFTGAVTGKPGDYTDTVTAVATDNDGQTDTKTNDATVTLTNVLPTIEVTKIANPTYVLIPGGNVTFTFVIKNTSTIESVTITSLSDSVYGMLAGDADCKVGTELLAGASCEFSITQFVGGSTAGQHINVFTAKAVDNDDTEATDTDDATVDILATTSKIAPTQTTCEQYRDGTAEDYTTLMYLVSKNKIGSVAPGVIFFWSTIQAPSESFSLEGHQFNDSGTLAWKDMGNLDVFLWDAACNKVQTAILTKAADGHPVLDVTNATPGATYYFSVKYDTSSLTGISVKKPNLTVNYTFQTWLNGALINTSPDSIAVKPKK